MDSRSLLKASLFFDDNGILARTERLVLKRPTDGEMMKYIDAFGGPNPLLAKEYRLSETLQRVYWEGVKGEDSLYCSICTNENGRFIGYCAVEELDRRPLEVGINLLKDYQAQGFGPEAMTAFIGSFREVAGPVALVARIEAENTDSQKMFRRLGFKLKGIDTFIIKDPTDLERFAQMRLDELGGIPEELKRFAEEFEVGPRRLLSHVLVFESEVDRSRR